VFARGLSSSATWNGPCSIAWHMRGAELGLCGVSPGAHRGGPLFMAAVCPSGGYARIGDDIGNGDVMSPRFTGVIQGAPCVIAAARAVRST
jgi:hypothetical protein